MVVKLELELQAKVASWHLAGLGDERYVANSYYLVVG